MDDILSSVHELTEHYQLGESQQLNDAPSQQAHFYSSLIVIVRVLNQYAILPIRSYHNHQI